MKTDKTLASLISLIIAVLLSASACAFFAVAPTDPPASGIPDTPVPIATAEVAASPTPDPTASPEPTPSPTPEPTATPEPTLSPTPEPTADPGAPGVVRLYNRRTRKLATGYDGKLIKGENNAEFFALPTDKASVETISPKALVEKYWDKYRKDGYQIGYAVDITLNTGEVIHLNIRRPKDAPPIQHEPMYFSKFVEIYMYDSAKLDHDGKAYGSWHLQQRFIKEGEKVLITSIKFHAGSRYSEVKSIDLTAYVYKNESEFDPNTGEYTGNLNYHILISRK